jgi:hypothetical protein
MFLRATTRKKDGKTHRYWSVVENRRLADGRVLQRHVLYLGEINDTQAHAWRRSIEVLDEREDASRCFPKTASMSARWKRRWWGCVCRSCGCVNRACGVHAGWR